MIRLLIASLLFAPPLAASINDRVFLEAIAEVETGNRDVVGAARERGPWQLTPAVRTQVGGHDYQAALKWLRMLKAEMGHYHIHVNPTNLALSWNAGIHATRKGRAPMSSYLYAQRVDNLYRALLKERR